MLGCESKLVALHIEVCGVTLHRVGLVTAVYVHKAQSASPLGSSRLCTVPVKGNLPIGAMHLHEVTKCLLQGNVPRVDICKVGGHAGDKGVVLKAVALSVMRHNGWRVLKGGYHKSCGYDDARDGWINAVEPYVVRRVNENVTIHANGTVFRAIFVKYSSPVLKLLR